MRGFFFGCITKRLRTGDAGIAMAESHGMREFIELVPHPETAHGWRQPCETSVGVLAMRGFCPG